MNVFTLATATWQAATATKKTMLVGGGIVGSAVIAGGIAMAKGCDIKTAATQYAVYGPLGIYKAIRMKKNNSTPPATAPAPTVIMVDPDQLRVMVKEAVKEVFGEVPEKKAA